MLQCSVEIQSVSDQQYILPNFPDTVSPFVKWFPTSRIVIKNKCTKVCNIGQDQFLSIRSFPHLGIPEYQLLPPGRKAGLEEYEWITVGRCFLLLPFHRALCSSIIWQMNLLSLSTEQIKKILLFLLNVLCQKILGKTVCVCSPRIASFLVNFPMWFNVPLLYVVLKNVNIKLLTLIFH